MKAVILAIGDELIMGQTVDTNSAWLSARLAEFGVMTVCHKTVPDDVGATVAALKEACDAADLVIVTGGLGPTEDDLTRKAFAEILGAPLDLHPPSLEHIRSFFKTLGKTMPASNRIQAMIPRGAEVVANDWGTAPGIKAMIGKSTLFALPGVPHEMMKMADRSIFSRFRGEPGHALAVECLHTFGAGESTVAEKLGALMRRDRNPIVGTTVSGGVVTVRIRSEAPTPVLARKALATTVKEVEAKLGSLVFGHGDETLSARVGQLARSKGQRIATAESCTGGLVARMVTDIAGASNWYVGGWITYSNEMKTRELGVSAELIDREGAVSEAVALAMAEGALQRSGSDWAVSLTGVAGPDGGTPEKPVGTVWIGLCRRDGERRITKAERFQFAGTRDIIRDRAAKTALNLLRLELTALPYPDSSSR